MPGMPSIPGMRGMDKFNAPTRTLTMELTSPKKADKTSKAQCAIPEGLKLGPKVDLVIDLPEPAREGKPEKPEKLEQSQKDFKLKTYWGCSETVPAGQPKVISSKEMNAAVQESMAKNKNYQAAWKHALDTADGSRAHYPGNNAKDIAKESAAPGDYQLTTNYAGGTSITFGEPQNFLAPFEIISPTKKVDWEKGIRVEWKAVPHALAYYITAFSGNENEMITWTSSLDPNTGVDVSSRALPRATVDAYVKNGILIPAEKTFCYIPQGIFKDSKNATLMLVAVGADKTQEKDGIKTEVVVRSNATTMLGTMGGPGMEDDEQTDKHKIKPSDDDGDAADKGLDNAEEGLNKADDVDGAADRAKDVINRAKNIFKKKR